MTRLLKCAACNIEQRDADGWTPLFVACLYGHKSNDVQIVYVDSVLGIIELLLENSAQIEVVENKYGWTPIFGAVTGDHAEVLSVLIRNHANVSEYLMTGDILISLRYER